MEGDASSRQKSLTLSLVVNVEKSDNNKTNSESGVAMMCFYLFRHPQVTYLTSQDVTQGTQLSANDLMEGMSAPISLLYFGCNPSRDLEKPRIAE